jgi:hypothetical protein
LAQAEALEGSLPGFRHLAHFGEITRSCVRRAGQGADVGDGLDRAGIESAAGGTGPQSARLDGELDLGAGSEVVAARLQQAATVVEADAGVLVDVLLDTAARKLAAPRKSAAMGVLGLSNSSRGYRTARQTARSARCA